MSLPLVLAIGVARRERSTSVSDQFCGTSVTRPVLGKSYTGKFSLDFIATGMRYSSSQE